MVSAIAPGAFASNMNKLARDEGEAVAKQIPARRIGTPDDMAGAAIFLASARATMSWARHWSSMVESPGRARDSNEACRVLGVYATARLGLNRSIRRGAICAAVGGRNRDGAGFWRRRFIAR